MVLFSYIEEKYCINSKKNVGVEHTHYEDGTVSTECLNKHNCTHDQCCCSDEE